MTFIRAVVLFLSLAVCFPAMAQTGTNNPPPVDKTVGGAQACNQLRDNAKKLMGHADELVGGNGMICPCAPKPGLWLERVVYCFADAPNGLIYGVVQSLIATLTPYYWGMMGPLILFAVTLFGWKLTTGSFRSLTKETFTFGLKLGGVVTFLAYFPIIHGLMLDMVQALAELAAEPFTHFSNICNFGSGQNTPTLWAQWDCMFGKIMGLSVSDKSSKFMSSGLMMGIVGYILPFLFIPGFGTGIVMAFLYVLFTLVAAALRAVNTYFMAVIAISFMFLISPLFVPLVLFGASYQRFYTWFQILISYILQPMMLIMFMGIMTVTLEYAIFKGPASLFGVFTNSSSNKAQYYTDQLLQGTQNGKKVNLTKNFAHKETVLGHYDMNPETKPAVQGHKESLNYDNPENSGAFKGLPTADPSVKGKGTTNIGIKTPNVNLDGYVDGLNQKDNAVKTDLTTVSWVERALLQLMTTGMLVYTLFTMLGKIPQITHDLVARQSGGNIATANVLGLAAAQKALALAKQAIKAYIAAKTGNKKALAEAIKKGYDNLVAER